MLGVHFFKIIFEAPTLHPSFLLLILCSLFLTHLPNFFLYAEGNPIMVTVDDFKYMEDAAGYRYEIIAESLD